MTLSKDELRKRLEELSWQQICWFALRAALRVQPILGLYDYSELWKKHHQRNLCALFRGLNGSVSGVCIFEDLNHKTNRQLQEAVCSNCNAMNDSVIATKAAFDVADAVSYANETAVNIDDFNLMLKAAIHTDDSANAAVDIFNYSEITAIFAERDLQSLAASNEFLSAWPDLWYNSRPKELDQGEIRLLAMLEANGLGYWARRYQEWVKGDFNKDLTLYALDLPEPFLDHEKADIPTLMAYLEAGEENIVNHNNNAEDPISPIELDEASQQKLVAPYHFQWDEAEGLKVQLPPSLHFTYPDMVEATYQELKSKLAKLKVRAGNTPHITGSIVELEHVLGATLDELNQNLLWPRVKTVQDDELHYGLGTKSDELTDDVKSMLSNVARIAHGLGLQFPKYRHMEGGDLQKTPDKDDVNQLADALDGVAKANETLLEVGLIDSEVAKALTAFDAPIEHAETSADKWMQAQLKALTLYNAMSESFRPINEDFQKNHKGRSFKAYLKDIIWDALDKAKPKLTDNLAEVLATSPKAITPITRLAGVLLVYATMEGIVFTMAGLYAIFGHSLSRIINMIKDIPQEWLSKLKKSSIDDDNQSHNGTKEDS